MGLIVFIRDEPSRSWLSFGVSWTSDRKTSYEKAILIKYVGEVALEINKELIELPRSYLSKNTYEILVLKNSEMTIHYFYRYNGFIKVFQTYLMHLFQ